MDKIAAAESIFGERVVHGYFLISAAAGCSSMPKRISLTSPA
ncbi:hypothetical protein C7D74_29600 [Klebsiella pneumoniae]|nr:hypothetical protein C7D74_29600 [Klebsiella pneumoniae]